MISVLEEGLQKDGSQVDRGFCGYAARGLQSAVKSV